MPRWKVILGLSAVSVGILAGIGLATLHYANATSYLSTNPAACVNCHIMQPQYDSWQKSSHHALATCVDCHLPHDSLVSKYLTKAEHGWNHSKGFTLQNFPEPIQISHKTAHVLQANCVRCHDDLVHAQSSGEEGAPDCRHCHRDVGHGPRAGLGGPLRPSELEPGNR